MGTKAKSLFLDSDFIAELKTINIEGGNVKVGKTYEHVIDDAVPLQLKGSLGGSTPLYILKWSSLVPIKFKRVSKIISTEQAKQMIEDDGFLRIEPTEREERKKKPKLRSFLWRKKHEAKQLPQIQNITTSEPTHYEYRKLEVVQPKLGKSDIPPALLKETLDMRFLKNMKKYGEGKGGGTGEGIGKGKTILVAIGSMVFGVVLFYLIFAYGGL
jgi:hypothetical protein